MTAILTDRGENTKRPRNGGRGTVEVETGGTQLRTKESQGLPEVPPEAKKRVKAGLFHGTLRKHGAASVFRLLASRTMRE